MVEMERRLSMVKVWEEHEKSKVWQQVTELD
jgi:hypothetical protein